MVRRLRKENGTALMEAAFTLPILLLIAVGIFEFGRAFQTWQVLTNAAREGARVAVLPNPDPNAAVQRVRDYMQMGQLPNYASATVTITATNVQVGASTSPGSQVRVSYPFSFIVLNPVIQLITPGSTTGAQALNMVSTATMRNESP
jgi:Flp pilus assembly protein TadG